MTKQVEHDPRAPIVTEWGGEPNYECPIEVAPGRRCGFVTLDANLIAEHLDPRWGMHRVPPDPIDGEQVPSSLATDEQAELVALRAEVAELNVTLEKSGRALTRAKSAAERAKARLAERTGETELPSDDDQPGDGAFDVNEGE